MNRPQVRRLVLVLALLLSTVGVDQATKALARSGLGYRPVTYLFDTLRLQHMENSGAFLSLGAGLTEQARFWIFTIGVAAVVAGALWTVVSQRAMKPWTTVALSLIVGGGIGNLIDRAMKGTVTDFLNMGIGSLRTGIFNVADMAIMAGIAILFVSGRERKAKA